MVPKGLALPKLTVEGYGTFEVAAGKRLVLAVEHDAGVDILHACGGHARCTTCRVEFIAGEPAKHTEAERERLAAKQLTGVRLSCQILCDHDMTIRAISRLEGSGQARSGARAGAHHHAAGSVGRGGQWRRWSAVRHGWLTSAGLRSPAWTPTGPEGPA